MDENIRNLYDACRRALKIMDEQDEFIKCIENRIFEDGVKVFMQYKSENYTITAEQLLNDIRKECNWLGDMFATEFVNLYHHYLKTDEPFYKDEEIEIMYDLNTEVTAEEIENFYRNFTFMTKEEIEEYIVQTGKDRILELEINQAWHTVTKDAITCNVLDIIDKLPSRGFREIDHLTSYYALQLENQFSKSAKKYHNDTRYRNSKD